MQAESNGHARGFHPADYSDHDQRNGTADCNEQVIEEQKKEERRRGDKKTRTSDARFDAQFTFGHNLAGPAHQVSGCLLFVELMRLTFRYLQLRTLLVYPYERSSLSDIRL